ncbi:MAG: hypothetical protein ACK5ZP_01600, partial [Betaproteobacteria bacterium]
PGSGRNMPKTAGLYMPKIRPADPAARWPDYAENAVASLCRKVTYAPELNPVEAIWAYLKKHEIANLGPITLTEVSDFARRRLKSMQRRPKLIRAFWQQTELAL